MKRVVVCTFLFVAALGCSRKDAREDAVSTTTVTSTEVAGPRQSSVASFLDDDPALTRSVEATIASDPALSQAARNVNVTTERGIVTLSGSVPDYATRDALEAAVSGLPGVRRTFDDVQVSPLRDSDKRESDENIAFSLQRSLADEPRVSIDVVEGVVTLRGTADASPEQIERIATRTPGVTSVVNELGEPPASTSLVQ